MNEKSIQIGDHTTHLGIDYCWFGDEEMHCPICGKELYRNEAYANRQPKRESCPHVLYFWEKTRFGGHFFFARPDFARGFILALLKSEYYKEFLQNPHRNNPHSDRRSMHHPRPLKKNDIALFASGAFSQEDPMFADSEAFADLRRFNDKHRPFRGFSSDGYLIVDSTVQFDHTRFREMLRSEEIGARVGNISFELPSVRHPEWLPDDVVAYYNLEGVGDYENHDARDRFIAISETEYHNPGVRGLSEL